MNRKNVCFSPAYTAKVAMLGVLSYVIMIYEFSLPIFPAFLKLDFSDLVPLIGSLALGPWAGLLAQLIKNLFHWLTASTTGGVGELANFVVGSAFVVTAGWYYKKHKSRSGALGGLLLGVAAMILAGALINYFVMVPFYAAMYFKEAGGVAGIVDMTALTIPAVRDKLTLVLFAFSPFNLIKGLLLTLITLPLYKHISPLLKAEHLTLRRHKRADG